MEFELRQAIDMLGRAPGTLDRLLRDVPTGWGTGNEGKETWSPFDVVGHFIHGERTDWIPRVDIIIEDGESRAFDAFDRFAQVEASKGKTLNELLDTFRELRERNLERLRAMNLSEEDLDRTESHPELGTVTMRQLIATWVAHDLGHFGQIVRAMAKQYAGHVGPWASFMPVLSRP
ncbi:MAG: DinB family protein [Planctomycetota bacterium]|nr:DinB family protein [Planctomycetota bacterium]